MALVTNSGKIISAMSSMLGMQCSQGGSFIRIILYQSTYRNYHFGALHAMQPCK